MNNYLLDTTVIIDYLRGRQEIVKLLKGLFSEGSSLGCCPINITEVYAGTKEKEKDITREFLNSLEYHQLTKEIAEEAGKYERSYREKGVTLSLPDVIIASIVIYINLILLTDNTKHYPLPKLKLQSPKTLLKVKRISSK